MRIADLIGFQLVAINEEKIVVKKGNEEYILHIKDYEGGCCGYNDIQTRLLIDEKDLSRNPIITKITMSTEETCDDGDSCKLTFFGELKAIAEIDTFSYSGSGFAYGACVSLECDEIALDETLSSW